MRVEKLAGNVVDLPGFAEGQWWVQDAAASLPARLFGDLAGLRVADLCAAPGGKTAQLVLAGAEVTAIDASKNRLARLGQNLERLGLAATLLQADILDFRPEHPFDAVLLDAPCSSTGTVRRHPDVPWTKSPADLEKLAALQAKMLKASVAWCGPADASSFPTARSTHSKAKISTLQFLAETPGVAHDPVAPGEIEGIDGFLTDLGTLRTTPDDHGPRRARHFGARRVLCRALPQAWLKSPSIPSRKIHSRINC